MEGLDYSYFGATPQPYQYIGLPPTPGFSQPGDEFTAPKVSSADPIDPAYLTQVYDPYRFSVIPTTSGSPPDLTQTHTPLQISNLDPSLDAPYQNGDEDLYGRRGSSEEKEQSLTAAQSRRKAQNRAAQRAFRERKERHVRDLEQKLTALESTSHTLQSDNERLKLALQRARTENEMLRTGSSSNPTSPVQRSRSISSGSNSNENGYSASGMGGIGGLNGAGQLLQAPATWDLIQSHPLVKQGVVDIADVVEQLKGLARCDGTGPVFDEREVWRAVEESKRGGGDLLI